MFADEVDIRFGREVVGECGVVDLSTQQPGFFDGLAVVRYLLTWFAVAPAERKPSSASSTTAVTVSSTGKRLKSGKYPMSRSSTGLPTADR